MSAVRSLSLVISISLLSSGCLALVKESYYAIHSDPGDVRRLEEPWYLERRGAEVASASSLVGLDVVIWEHATYPVLSGPLIACVLPVGAVAWMWYQPLGPGPQISFDARGPRNELSIRPEEIRLRLTDGTLVSPSDTYIDRMHFRTAFELPGEEEEEFELLIEGVSIDGEKETFGPLAIRRRSEWVWTVLDVAGRSER